MDEHSLTRILQQQLRFSSKIKSADAAVLIAITNEENPKVLLTRRSVYLSNHAGEVSFPGGKRDPQDTSNILVPTGSVGERSSRLIPIPDPEAEHSIVAVNAAEIAWRESPPRITTQLGATPFGVLMYKWSGVGAHNTSLLNNS
jgi:hypothetical protein